VLAAACLAEYAIVLFANGGVLGGSCSLMFSTCCGAGLKHRWLFLNFDLKELPCSRIEANS